MSDRNALKYFEEQNEYMSREVTYGIETYRKANA